MKKLLPLIAISFVLAFSSATVAHADNTAGGTITSGTSNQICDESSTDGFFGPNSGEKGLVPCGKNLKTMYVFKITTTNPIVVHHDAHRQSEQWENSFITSQSQPLSQQQMEASYQAAHPQYTNVACTYVNSYTPPPTLLNPLAIYYTTVNWICTGDQPAWDENITNTDVSSTAVEADNAANAQAQINTMVGPTGSSQLVGSGEVPVCRCELGHVFVLTSNVYKFALLDIATPLATLLLMIGGVMMLISGGNPGLANRGKGLIKIVIIAIILMFGAYIMIDVLLKAIGYTQAWSSFSF